MHLCHFIVFFWAFMYHKVTCDVFTALAHLEDFLDTEKILSNSLQSYIKAEEQKLKLLRKYADIYEQHHHKAIEDVNSYISNPINAYTLIKRLTTDWANVEELLSTQASNGILNNLTYFKETMMFPNDENLSEIAEVLTSLQDIYKLNTSALARGELNGVKYSTELTAADCFELGRQRYKNGDYYNSWLWMKEAEDRLNNEKNETISQSDILEYLALSTYKQGDLPLALDLTNKLLENIPTHSIALENKIYYEAELEKLGGAVKKKVVDDDVDEFEYVQDRDDYKSLCRGETKVSEEVASKLKCRYLSYNNPFLKIAPFKVEEAYLKPDLFIFYDVMSDAEIETIKQLALPSLKRAEVFNPKTGEPEYAQHRISKTTWLDEHEHKYIAAISQRIEDMTGLSLKTAEPLQVGNYGIGGHFDQHFDFVKKGGIIGFWPIGNRIATVLFYMSDVAQGGATVFPRIGAALWPKKGSAAFWFNLHPSGDGDILTEHAACPVLAGSKWVSNKWIHEYEQEFRRPCTLEKPPEELTI